MKIVSLNRELTLNAHNLAFNLDQEITQEIIDLLEYGYLKISGSGYVLKVVTPAHEQADFDQHAVATLQSMLNDAVGKIEGDKAKHQRMLENLAKSMSLPLA